MLKQLPRQTDYSTKIAYGSTFKHLKIMRVILFRSIPLCLLFCSCSLQRTTQTDLYFGGSKLDGGMVTEAEWNTFVQQYVSKVYPEGSTVIKATGNWYDTAQHKIIAEPSNVIIAINRMTPKLDRQIDSLRYWYKVLYKQQSVLRIDKK